MAKILVVDDDELQRSGYKRSIGSKHEVTLAKDGLEALELIVDGLDPDIVLSDGEMPRMTGAAFCAALRERGNEVAFVIISGSMEMAAKATKAGATDFLLKPARMSDIEDVIERHARK